MPKSHKMKFVFIFLLIVLVSIVNSFHIPRRAGKIVRTQRLNDSPTFVPNNPSRYYQIFVGNIPFESDDSSLQSIFSEKLSSEFKFHLAKDLDGGKSRGFGYLQFFNQEDTNNAFQMLTGITVNGNPLRLTISKSPKPPTEFTVYFSNLDFSCTSHQIMAMCDDLLGKEVALNARIAMAADSGLSRGFAFVVFRTLEDANRAVKELNGVKMHGREIRVSLAVTRNPVASPKPFRPGRPFSPTSIFLGNIRYDIESSEIIAVIDMLMGPGKVKNVRRHTDINRRLKGYCHIEFVDNDAQKEAVEKLNGHNLKGRTLIAEIST